MSGRVAVYTTVFPAIKRFLPAWYESILRQTDRDFDLFIGCDAISPDEVRTLLGRSFDANWCIAPPGSTPTLVREVAIQMILKMDSHESVIFVDADDVLHPTRVEAARGVIENSDVAGCGLEIINEDGSSTGTLFGPRSSDPNFDELLPRCNFFGMSNTAYRTSVLSRCLPLPAECPIMDWFLVTRAWALGSSLAYDPVARMYYRQYSSNLARVLPPFSAAYIRHITAALLSHYRYVLADVPELKRASRIVFESAQHRVLKFQQQVTNDETNLNRYLNALNALPPSVTWWTSVARPELEEMWNN